MSAASDFDAASGADEEEREKRGLGRDWEKNPYGGVTRQDRIKDGPFCDKAWHMDGGKGPVLATAVLRCADCKRVYARCAECNRGGDTVQVSMRAHIFACHRQNHALKRKVMPR